MGDFRITVDAVGNHGCSRGTADGQQVEGCGEPSCVDCMSRRFVNQLKSSGASVIAAKLEHWPAVMQSGTPRESGVGPVDDLLTGIRHGSF